MATLVRGLIIPPFQSVLDAVAMQTFGSAEDNSRITTKINSVRRAFSLGLRLTDSQEPVYLRCARGPRSKHGTVQAVSSDRARTRQYSAGIFPRLEAFDTDVPAQ